jgi:hypothetical protein
VARRGVEAIAVLFAAGCSPSVGLGDAIPEDFVDRYAAARCGAATRCACDPSGWVDEAMCTAAMHMQFDDRVAALRDDGVRLDAVCLDALIEFWGSAAACDPGARVPYCALVRGEAELDEPCASLSSHGFSASSCVDGLFCSAGEACSEPPVEVELQLGASCIDAQYACVDGTFCDDAGGVCATKRGEGNECRIAAACDDTTWCAGLDGETPGTCTARAGEGEACASTSAWDARPCQQVDGASRYCVDGTCTLAVAAACGPWL